MRPMQAALSVLALAAGAAAHADILVFDNMTPALTSVPGASLASTSSTPNTFMGGGYTLATGTTSITGFDVFPANLSGTSFDHLQITIFVWDNINTTGTVNATTPAFSNLLGTYTLTAAGTFSTGFYFPFVGSTSGVVPGITLTTPLAISDDVIGMTFNYQGSTDGGLTYSNVNNLTSIISAGGPAVVGSNIFSGYYRNAASESDGNFVSSLRSLGGLTNQSVGVRIYTTPAPGAAALVGLGGLAVARRRRR